MSAGSARPLEDAFRIAQHDMVTWVAGLCGLDPLDAYQLVTQAVESPLANVCDTNYTSIAKMAKRYLAPGPAWTARTPGCVSWPASTGPRAASEYVCPGSSAPRVPGVPQHSMFSRVQAARRPELTVTM